MIENKPFSFGSAIQSSTLEPIGTTINVASGLTTIGKAYTSRFGSKHPVRSDSADSAPSARAGRIEEEEL
jgi:hypothetical protein